MRCTHARAAVSHLVFNSDSRRNFPWRRQSSKSCATRSRWCICRAVCACCDADMISGKKCGAGEAEGRALGCFPPISAAPDVNGTLQALGVCGEGGLLGVEQRHQQQTLRLCVRWPFESCNVECCGNFCWGYDGGDGGCGELGGG